MSIFDPYAIYNSGSFCTKKGQVIQKKLVKRKSPFSREDLEEARKVLDTYGYVVIPKNYLVQTSDFATVPFVFQRDGAAIRLSLGFNELFSICYPLMDHVFIHKSKLKVNIVSLCLKT